ncbi:MAG: FHA domain-containing protein [Gomphosphaeria aponina SAG 52.96 = DSM 107014]|uniref:FHA domain-containing protein n=1 Tax=Gomphosphaeria aponina SAG 52.96 = DSM 107014 TaxID=1521640 RepID=A0A941GMD8_9CHRO|nr:FHA domain-containing protein [Gomphosphaeria aponina SAG 52.96 = DSM 107014]
MESMAEKLVQRIININQYLGTRPQLEQSYHPLIQELNRVMDFIASVKPRVKVVSNFPELAEGLKNLSAQQPSLSNLYLFESAALNKNEILPENFSICAVFEQERIGYELKEKKKILIGRGKDCDLVIPKKYNSVSRYHAEIRPTVSGWEVCDLNSSNGVYVQGERVKESCRSLQKGDRIFLGKPDISNSVELSFELASPPAQYVLLSSGYLKLGEAVQYALLPRQKVCLGRDPSCKIIIPVQYGSVSKRHAEIISDGQGWHLRDLNSSHGTFINGERLVGSSFVPLHLGDKINLGELNNPESLELIFKFHTPEDTSLSLKFEPLLLLKNCDVLILVYQPTKTINFNEIELIKVAIKAKKQHIIIVVDGERNPRTPEAQANITALQSWVQSNNRNKVISLVFASLVENNPNLREYTQLLEEIFKAVNAKYFQELSHEINQKIDWGFNQIKVYLKNKIKTASQGMSESELQTETSYVFKEIAQDKENIFRQFKQEINKSRVGFLLPWKPHSLGSKLEKFISQLKTNQGEDEENVYLYLYVEGTEESESIHQRLVALLKPDFVQWMGEEWEKICNFYAVGGLNGFWMRSKSALHEVIPNFSPQDFSCEPGKIPPFNLETLLDVSVLTEENQDLGDEWFSLVSQGIYCVNKQDVDTLNIEETTENLRTTLLNKYQSLVKIVTEKLFQVLMGGLEQEKLRINQTLAAIASATGKQIDQLQSKNQQLSDVLTSLEADQVEVLKLLKGE